MVDTNGKIRVFVYGTLKRKQPLHGLLERGRDVEYIGRDYIEEQMCMIDMGAFPAIIRDDYKDELCSSKLFGEVYTVDVWVYILKPEAAQYVSGVIGEGVWNPTKGEAKYVSKHS
jgi:gamma-glutamylcyclotransferase (GGCT)/AIG2-like uncharacterized protein YtfP